MKIVTKLADRMINRVVPQRAADACIAPDCYTQRCCYTCTGTLRCS